MPPVALTERQTVGLSATTVVPVMSADAVMVQGGDAWLLEAPTPSADLAYRLMDPPIGVKALIDGGPSGSPASGGRRAQVRFWPVHFWSGCWPA